MKGGSFVIFEIL